MWQLAMEGGIILLLWCRCIKYNCGCLLNPAHHWSLVVAMPAAEGILLQRWMKVVVVVVVVGRHFWSIIFCANRVSSNSVILILAAGELI